MPPWLEYFRGRRWTGKTVADFAPWWRLARDAHDEVVDGVVELKRSGGLLRCYQLRGLDWLGVTREAQGAKMLAANDALKRLPGAWTVNAEAQRAPVGPLAPIASPYDIPQRIHADRCQQMQAGHGVRATNYYMGLTWFPEDGQPVAPREFVEAADDFMDNLRALLAVMAPLTHAEQLTYLHNTVSDVWHEVAVPEDDTDLDLYLCAQDWDSGAWRAWDARLGAWHVRVLSMTGYPGQSWAGMLRDVESLPVDMRWCTGWSGLGAAAQDSVLKAKQQNWARQQWTIGQRVKAGSGALEGGVPDVDKHLKSEDVSVIRQEVGADILALGHFVTTLITWGDTAAAADTQVRRLTQALQRHGFVVRQEGAKGTWYRDHEDAWLAAQPGNTLMYRHKTVQTSLTAAHLMPGFQAAWPGPLQDDYLQAPPWLLTQTELYQLVRIVNHVYEVGHFVAVGPTGSGKSTWLWLLAMYWTQYAGQYEAAQIFAFDKDKAGRLPTLLLGGHWYDLGALSFQPLRHIDTPFEVERAIQWLVERCEDAAVPEEGGKVRMYLTGGHSGLAGQAAARADPLRPGGAAGLADPADRTPPTGGCPLYGSGGAPQQGPQCPGAV